MPRIFHIASAEEWATAQRSGSYTTSTRGRTLDEEGFIHASRANQWQGVKDRYYADVTEPLVLLAIETDDLSAPVVEERLNGSDSTETFPHIYGPITPAAVVNVIPLDGRSVGQDSFSKLFFAEMFGNLVLGVVLMICVAGGAFIGQGVDDQFGALAGTAAGLAVGIPLVVLLNRRRRR